jgi:uncharacterized protein with von Willebrand factor type A (vWA) domain
MNDRPIPDASQPGTGALTANLMHFARALRVAGLPIGPGRVIDAVHAVRAAGITNRTDFYWTLHAIFVNKRDQHDLFDEAFRLFWRDPQLLERMMAMLLPQLQVPSEEQRKPTTRRVAEALRGHDPNRKLEPAKVEETVDATLTWSDREVLRTKDFEQMSSEEVENAKAMMTRLRLPFSPVKTRRYKPDPAGARADLRATLKATMRTGGDLITLRFRTRRERLPPIVILCDISGSMERYSRMFLHFLHALTNDRSRVYTFLFGTRLTNVTRHMKFRDIDQALARVAGAVEDWSGGTRIGHALCEFNLKWSRRVLGQNAVVLFISDGLDRDAGVGLAREMERLHKSCHRLVWLNPLLRYDGFEPKSQGMRAILPHVDEFRAAHNLASLEDLIKTLGDQSPQKSRSAYLWQGKAA